MSNNDQIEISASTVEEAINQALEALSAEADDVTIEVLATARSGVLGLGARQARVRVTRRPQLAATSGVQSPPPAPPSRARAESPARSEAAKTGADSAPAQQHAERPREAREHRPAPARGDRMREERAREPRRGNERRSDNREETRRQNRGEPNRAPGRVPQERAREQNRPPQDDSGDERGENREAPARPARSAADLDAQTAVAIEILTRMLELMGDHAQVVRVPESDPDSLELDIKGDGSGILIGRHGQTLDALEYVLNRMVARKVHDAAPIMLETESYRARRRQQLHRMALSMGERAKREHQPVMLEPMPPRDRRIIHIALKDDPMLTTRSSGEGFLRAVEIVPAGGGRPRRDDQGQGRGRRRDRDRERDRDQESDHDSDRDREREHPQGGAVGEQGGFKHGQKRIV